jgi:hypothetical protein
MGVEGLRMADEALTPGYSAMERAWSEWAATAEECPVCHVYAVPVPLAGGRWGVAIHHEDGCPLAVE